MARMPNYFYNGGQAAVNASPWAAAASSLGQALFGDPREIRAREAAEQEGQLRNLEMEKLQLGLETARAEAESNAAFAASIEDWQRTRGQPQPAASPLGGVFAEQDPSTGGVAQGQALPSLTTSAAPSAPSLVGAADVADQYGFGGIPGVDEASLTTVRDDTAALPQQGQPPASPLGQAFAEPEQAPQSPQMRSISDALNAMNDFEIMAIAQEPTAAGKRKVFNDIMLKRGEEARKAGTEEEAGLFGGTGMDAQAYNIIYRLDVKRSQGQPLTPEEDYQYRIAQSHLEASPRWIETPDGWVPVTRNLPSMGGGGAPATQPSVAPVADAAPGAPAPAPAPAPRGPAGYSVGGAIPGKKSGELSVDAKKQAQIYSIIAPEVDLIDQYYDSLSGWGSATSLLPADAQKYQSLFTGENHQRATNALRTIVQQVIYSESGATAPEQEVQRLVTSLTPVPGEEPASLADKKARIKRMVDSVALRGGIDVATPQGPGLDQPPPSGGGQNWILDENGELVPEQ